MRDVRQIAAAYIALGWQVVPAKPMSKATIHKDWPVRVYAPDDFGESANIGIKLGAASNGLVDIDCDCPEAVALAPTFLPETWTFGRHGEGKNPAVVPGLTTGFVKHYLFQLSDQIDTKTIKPVGTFVEWRASKAQTIAPGSIHEDTGRPIEWTPGISTPRPTLILEMNLRRCFASLSIATVLARIWPQAAGGRHHIVMGLAGALWRAGWTLEEAKLVILSAAELAGAEDTHERVIDDTWADDHERNRGGWPMLEEIFGPVTKTLRKLVRDCSPQDKDAATTEAGGYVLNESGNADRLLDVKGQDLRYIHGMGWLRWSGQIWETDPLGPVPELEEIARQIREEAQGRPAEEGAALAGWGLASGNIQKIRGAMAIAAARKAVRLMPDQLDVDPWLLNTPGGVVDMRTGLMRPAQREDLCTQMTRVAPDFGRPCPTFVKFLTECMNGDPELVRYVLLWLGYCLSGDVRVHAFHIWHGAGRNGKGTLQNIMRFIWGDYASTVDPGVLLSNGTDQHPTGLMDFRGKRLILTSEPKEGKRWNEALIKRLTGGDAIKARWMAKDFVEFNPTWKIVMATNTRPQVREVSGAIWSRVRLVPWDVSFLGREDHDLAAKLEDEAPAILALIIRAGAEALRNGLGTSERVRREVAEYRRSQDILGLFFSECCAVDAASMVDITALYSAYQFWATEARVLTVDRMAFRRILEERGNRVDENADGVMLRGYKMVKQV